MTARVEPPAEHRVAELVRLTAVAEQMGRVLGVRFVLNPEKVARFLRMCPLVAAPCIPPEPRDV